MLNESIQLKSIIAMSFYNTNQSSEWEIKNIRNEYQCIDKGCEFVFPVPVQVTPLPAVISRNYSSDLTITCNATGRPVPTLSWLKDGNTLQTAQGIEVIATTLNNAVYSVLSITSLQLEHQGMYTCLASNDLPNGTLTHTSSFTLNLELNASESMQ